MYNRIHPNSVRSTYFTILDLDGVLKTVYFRDNAGNPPNYNGSGELELWQVDETNNTSTLLLPRQGTVNYATGEISTRQFTPRGFKGGIGDMRFMADVQESNFDVQVVRNVLLTLDDSLFVPTAGLNPGLSILVTAVSE
jgi:hypothetical protein